MATLNLAEKIERRTGFVDRRRYQYNSHIPERRSLYNRRNQQDPQTSNPESDVIPKGSSTENAQ